MCGSLVKLLPKIQLRPEGRNTRGDNRLRGPEILVRPSEFDPSFRKFGVAETASQGPLAKALRGPWEALQGPWRGSQGLWGCPFSTEREKKVGNSKASKRSRFSGCPLRGFQTSGSYPQVRDKRYIHGCTSIWVLSRPFDLQEHQLNNMGFVR